MAHRSSGGIRFGASRALPSTLIPSRHRGSRGWWVIKWRPMFRISAIASLANLVDLIVMVFATVQK